MAKLKGSIGNYSEEQIIGQIARGSRYYDEEMAKSEKYGANYMALLASIETEDISDYSAFNDKTFLTLTDPDSRVEYLMNEYNKNVLSIEEYASNKKYFDLLALQNTADEMYNSLSGFEKVMNEVGSFVTTFLYEGTVGIIDDLADLGALLAGSIGELFGAEEGTAAEMVRNSDLFGLDSAFYDSFNSWAQVANISGRNYVTGETRDKFWGEVLPGIASSLGKIAASFVTAGAAGAAGLSVKAASKVSQGVYYASMAGASAEEGASTALVDPNALQLLVYTGANTALEAISESIGGWTPGGKTLTNFTSRVTNTFARWGIGAATEGFEEMFSETLGFIIPLAINEASSKEVFNVEYPTIESVLTAGMVGAICGGIVGGFQMISTKNSTITVDGNEHKLTKGQSQLLQEAIDSSIEISESYGIEALKTKTGILDDAKLQEAFPKEYKEAVDTDTKNAKKAENISLQLANLMRVVGEKTFAEGLKIYEGTVNKALENINGFYEAVSINGSETIGQQIKGAVDEYTSAFGKDNTITLDVQRDTQLKEGIAGMIQSTLGRSVVFVKDFVQKEGKPVNSGIAMTDNYVFVNTNHYLGSSSNISTMQILQETIAKDVTNSVYNYLDNDTKKILNKLIDSKKYKNAKKAVKSLRNTDQISKNELQAYINVAMSNAIENDHLFSINKEAFKNIAEALNNTLKDSIADSTKNRYTKERTDAIYAAISLFKKTMINNVSNDADSSLAHKMMDEINTAHSKKKTTDKSTTQFTEADERTIRTNIDNKKGTLFGNIGTFALDSTEESINFKTMVTDLESFAKDPTKLNVNGKLSLAVILDPTTYTNEFIKQVIAYKPNVANANFYSAMMYYIADVYHLVLNTKLNTVFAITGLDGANLKPEFVEKYFNPDLSGEDFGKLLLDQSITLGAIYTDEFFDSLPFDKKRIEEIKNYKVSSKILKKSKLNENRNRYLALTDDKGISFNYEALTRYKIDDIQNAFFHEMVHVLNTHTGFIGASPDNIRDNILNNLAKDIVKGNKLLSNLKRFVTECGKDFASFKNRSELATFVGRQIYANTIGEMLANDRVYDAGADIEDGFKYEVDGDKAKIVGVGDFDYLSIDLELTQRELNRLRDVSREKKAKEQSELVSQMADDSALPEEAKSKSVYEYDARFEKYRSANWENLKGTKFYAKLEKGLRLTYTDIIEAFDAAIEANDIDGLNMLMEVLNTKDVSLDMAPVSKLLKALNLSNDKIGDVLGDANSFLYLLSNYADIHMLNRIVFDTMKGRTGSKFYSSKLSNILSSLKTKFNITTEASIFSTDLVNLIVGSKKALAELSTIVNGSQRNYFKDEYDKISSTFKANKNTGIHSIYKKLLNKIFKGGNDLTVAFNDFNKSLYATAVDLEKNNPVGDTEAVETEKSAEGSKDFTETIADYESFMEFLKRNKGKLKTMKMEDIDENNSADETFLRIAQGLLSISNKKLTSTAKVKLLYDSLSTIVNMVDSDSKKITDILSGIFGVKKLTLDKFIGLIGEKKIIDQRAVEFLKNPSKISNRNTYYLSDVDKYTKAIESIDDSNRDADDKIDAYSKLFYEISENRRASLNTEEMAKFKEELKERGAENLKVLSKQALEYAAILSVNDPDSDIANRLNNALGIAIDEKFLKPTIPMNQRSAVELRGIVDDYRNFQKEVVEDAVKEGRVKSAASKVSKAVRAKAEIENMKEVPTTPKGIVNELLRQKNVRTSIHTNVGANEDFIDSEFIIDSYEDYLALNASVLDQITVDNVDEVIKTLKKRINQGLLRNSALGIIALTAIYNRCQELGIPNSALMPILSIQSMAGKILALSKMIDKKDNKSYYNIAKFKEKIYNEYDIEIDFTDAETIDFAGMIKEFSDSKLQKFMDIGNKASQVMYDCMKSLGISTVGEMEDLIVSEMGYEKVNQELSYSQIEKILNTYIAAKKILMTIGTMEQFRKKATSSNATEEDIYKYSRMRDSLIDAYYDFAVATDNVEAQEKIGKKIIGDIVKKVEENKKGKKIDWKNFGKKLSNFRYTAMLSNPSTWVKNILTNYGLLGMHKITHFLQSKIYDKLQIKYSGLTNQTRVTYKGSIDSEVTQFVNNNKLLEELSKGTKLINVDAGTYNDNTYLVKRETENFSKLKKWMDLVEWALDDSRFTLPAIKKHLSEILMANKEPIRGLFLSQIKSEVARKYKESSERMKAEEIEIEKSKDFKYVLEHIDNDTLYPYIKTATDMALNEYLRDESNLYKTIKTVLYATNNPVAVLGRSLLSAVDPFCRVSANILTMAFEFSPGGFLCAALTKRNIDAAIKAGSENLLSQFELNKLSKQMARATAGTVMMIFGMFLRAIGFIDYDEEDYMGYTVKFNLGDGATIKLKLSDLSPSITPVLLGAAVHTTAHENGNKFTLLEYVGNIGGTLYESSLLGTIDNFVQYNSSLPEIGLNILTSYLNQYIPTVVYSVAKIVNPSKIRKSSDAGLRFLQNCFYKVNFGLNIFPGFFNYKVNPYSGVMTNGLTGGNGWYNIVSFINMFSPIKIGYTGAPTDIEKAYTDVGAISTVPTGNFSMEITTIKNGKVVTEKKEFSIDSLDRYTFELVKANYVTQNAGDLINSAAYQKMSDDEKRKALNRIAQEAFELAKRTYYIGEGNEYYENNDNYYRKFKEYLDKNLYKYKK